MSCLFVLQTADVQDVLPFIVQHMDDSKDVCNSLQVCKAWRECLAEYPGCLAVELRVGTPRPRKAARFAAWLQRYGKLVQSIELANSCLMKEDSSEPMAVAESLIGQSQLTTAQLRPLHTTMVYERDLQMPAILSSLPACSLTKLTLKYLRPSDDTVCALARSLGHLHGLKDVSLLSGPAGYGSEMALGVFPAACLSGLKQLSNLTSLIMKAHPEYPNFGLHQWGSGVEQYLPPQLRNISASYFEAVSGGLQHLTGLTYLKLAGGKLSLTQLPIGLQELSATTDGDCTVSLSNLTCLASVTIEASQGLKPGSSLPKNLPQLCLKHTPLWSDAGIVLSGVRNLCVENSPTQPTAAWRQLRMLKNLQTLGLHYCETLESAAAAAPVWGDLPSLQELTVDPDVEGDLGGEESEALATIVSRLASARSLQELDIRMCGSDLSCGIHIANLSRLQSLRLVETGAGREDLLQLTKLSQLTHLELESVHLDDMLCASLVCNLAHLQHLSLGAEKGSLGAVVLVIIAHQLKSLQFLQFECSEDITDECLPHLTRLTTLTRLWFTSCKLSQAGRSQLKRALPKCWIF
jgi:hypothetical protein